MTKTKEKIRDAEADKFINRLLGDCDYCDLNKSSFVSGFDCRDKLDSEESRKDYEDMRRFQLKFIEADQKLRVTNEALKIAVEALEFYGDPASYESSEITLDMNRKPLANIVNAIKKDGHFIGSDNYTYISGKRAQEALQSIEKFLEGKK